MAMRKKGKNFYGDNTDDLIAELRRYAKLNGYPIDAAEEQSCACCGEQVFTMFSDGEDGGALLRCTKCAERRFVTDSEEHLDENQLEQHACLCGNEALQVAVGLALYEGTQDVRWVYVGAYCPQCGLVGTYIDWNER